MARSNRDGNTRRALHNHARTRRQFLRRSAAGAGAALGLPLILPRSVLGLGQPAPSARVTLGFIGLGWKGFEGCWGSLLQTFIADRSCQVLAVCDVDRRYIDRAKSFVDQTYANGVTVSHTDHDVSKGVTFFGSEGRVNLMAVSGRAVFEPAELGLACQDFETQSNDLLANKGHYANFLDCVRDRKTPAADVEIGCRTVTVCLLANIAHALQRPLRWDPVQEEFPNDPEANRFLARAHRDPWSI
jgi:hypothetical protein